MIKKKISLVIRQFVRLVFFLASAFMMLFLSLSWMNIALKKHKWPTFLSIHEIFCFPPY